MVKVVDMRSDIRLQRKTIKKARRAIAATEKKISAMCPTYTIEEEEAVKEGMQLIRSMGEAISEMEASMPQRRKRRFMAYE